MSEFDKGLFVSSRDVITYKSVSLINNSLNYIAGLDKSNQEKNDMTKELVETIEADVAGIMGDLVWARGVMRVVDKDDVNIILDKVTEYLNIADDAYLKQLNYKK